MYNRLKSCEDCVRSSEYVGVQNEAKSGVCDKLGRASGGFLSPNCYSTSKDGSPFCEMQENNSALSDQTYRKYLEEMHAETGNIRKGYCCENFLHDNTAPPETNRILQEPPRNSRQLERAALSRRTDLYTTGIGHRPVRREYAGQSRDKQHITSTTERTSISPMPCCSSMNSQNQPFAYQPMAGEPIAIGHYRLYEETHTSIISEKIESETGSNLEKKRSSRCINRIQPLLHGSRINNTCLIRDYRTNSNSPPMLDQNSTEYQDRCQAQEAHRVDKLDQSCSPNIISDDDFYGKVIPQNLSPTDQPVSRQNSFRQHLDSDIVYFNNDDNCTAINYPIHTKNESNFENRSTDGKMLCDNCKDYLVKSNPTEYEKSMTFAEMDVALDSIEELLGRRQKLNVRTDQLTGYFVRNMDLALKENLQNSSECKGVNAERINWHYSSDEFELTEDKHLDQSSSMESFRGLAVEDKLALVESLPTGELGENEYKHRCASKKASGQRFSDLKPHTVVNRTGNSSHMNKFKLPPINKQEHRRPAERQIGSHKSTDRDKFCGTDDRSEETETQYPYDRMLGFKPETYTDNWSSKVTYETNGNTLHANGEKGFTRKTSLDRQKTDDMKPNQPTYSSNQPNRRKYRKKYKSMPTNRHSKQRYKGAPVDLNVVENRAFWPGFDTVLPLVGRLKSTNRSRLT